MGELTELKGREKNQNEERGESEELEWFGVGIGTRHTALLAGILRLPLYLHLSCNFAYSPTTDGALCPCP